jgi:hypothetical protein
MELARTLYERADLRLAADVGLNGRAADLAPHRVGGFEVQVGDHDGPGALVGHGPRERAADAAAGAGDHNVPIV